MTLLLFFKRIRSPLFFSLIFIAVIYAGFVFFNTVFLVEKKDVRHFIFDKKTGTINGFVDGYLPPENFVFPDEIDGVPVRIISGKTINEKKAIGKKKGEVSVFSTNAPRIKTIVLPRYLEQIGFSAFIHCSNLSNIEIPATVHYIGKNAFRGCLSLKKIALPNQLCFIGDTAFRDCLSLEFITTKGVNPFFKLLDIPQSEPYRFGSSVGKLAFYQCNRLKFVALPPQINALHPAVFYNCQQLKNVSLPDQLKFIYSGVFSHCTNLRVFNGTKNLTYLSKGAFLYCENLREVNLPDSLEYIGGAAFFHCKNLTHIQIPEKVTALKNLTFATCTSLKKVILSKNLTYFNYGAFFDSGNQLSIHIPQPNPKKITFFNNIFGSDKYKGIEKIVVPADCVKEYQKNICKPLRKKIVGAPLKIKFF